MDSATIFVRAWFVWKRQIRPTNTFESGRRNAEAYGLECDIDHLSSSVYQLGMAHLSRASRDFTRQAIELLREVDTLVESVQHATLTSAEKEKYLSYLRYTQQVLDALRSCYVSQAVK